MHERMLHGIFQNHDADGQPELLADLGGKIEHPLPLLVRLLTGTHAQRLSHGLPSQRVGVPRWPPREELAAAFADHLHDLFPEVKTRHDGREKKEDQDSVRSRTGAEAVYTTG